MVKPIGARRMLRSQRGRCIARAPAGGAAGRPHAAGDPARHPGESVLTILLATPRITEEDVVRLAARRPTTAGAQRTILRSERFIARYGVKRALVLNPYTPTDLAARLVVLLTRPDQLAVANDPSLSDPVREAAREALG